MSIECLGIYIENIPIDIVSTLCYQLLKNINLIVNISPLGNQRYVTMESHVQISNNTAFNYYLKVMKEG